MFSLLVRILASVLVLTVFAIVVLLSAIVYIVVLLLCMVTGRGGTWTYGYNAKRRNSILL